MALNAVGTNKPYVHTVKPEAQTTVVDKQQVEPDETQQAATTVSVPVAAVETPQDVPAIAVLEMVLSRVEPTIHLDATQRLVLVGAMCNGLPNHQDILEKIYLPFREVHHHDYKSQSDYATEFEAYAKTGKAPFNSIFKILRDDLKVELTPAEHAVLSAVSESAGEKAAKVAKTPLAKYQAALLDLNDPEGCSAYNACQLPPRNDDTTITHYFANKGLNQLAGSAYESFHRTIVPLEGLTTDSESPIGFCNYQTIRPDGSEKRCLTGEPSKGAVYFTPNKQAVYASPTVGICEGAATAESAYHSTGIPQIAAINSCNIPLAAVSLIEFGAAEKILLLADTGDLSKVEHRVKVCQAGIAAKGSSCVIGYVMPNLEGSNKDFNDLMVLSGVEAVKVAVETALTALDNAPNAVRKYHLTELGNGERLADFIHTKLRFTSGLSSWIEHDGKRWMPISRKPLNEAKDLLEQMRGSALGDEVLTKWQAKAETAKGIDAMIKLSVAYGLEVDFMQFDSNQFELNCLNGLLDLNDFILHPHHYDQRVSKLAGANFNPDATKTLWLKFINEFTCGDTDTAIYLQKLLGLCQGKRI